MTSVACSEQALQLLMRNNQYSSYNAAFSIHTCSRLCSSKHWDIEPVAGRDVEVDANAKCRMAQHLVPSLPDNVTQLGRKHSWQLDALVTSRYQVIIIFFLQIARKVFILIMLHLYATPTIQMSTVQMPALLFLQG